MKKVLPLFCLALAILSAARMHAQELHGWRITFHVFDESGQPVAQAKATVYYDQMVLPNGVIDPGNMSGFTDSNGVFTAAHHDQTCGLRFKIEKDGYYTTDWVEDSDDVLSLEKSSQNLNVVLKKIGKPIAMYAKRVQAGPPELNKPAGYDLMVGDWVGPYGKGITADIIFSSRIEQKPKDITYKLTVSFPTAGDGIQEFTAPTSENGSGLRSAHEAPTNGYLTQVVRSKNSYFGQRGKGDIRQRGKDDINDPNRSYYFRVRTKVDGNGNLVSAHYGKIYGDFMLFTYYLNPTPNDRNIEFDPRRNLIHNLEPVQQISAP